MMRCLSTRFTIIVALIGCVIAEPQLTAAAEAGDAREEFCFDACRAAFKNVRFVDSSSSTSFMGPECGSLLHLKSLYICVGTHCSRETYMPALEGLNQTCEDTIGERIPPYSIVDDYTDEDVENLPRFNISDPPAKTPAQDVFLPTDDLVNIWIRTYSVQKYIHFYHYSYGWLMGVFWAVVVALGMMNRLAKLIEVRSTSSLSESKFWRWYKMNVGTPATFGRRCAQDYAGMCTVPPLVQTLTIGVFILINVFCSIHGYQIFPGHMYWPSTTKQVLRHLSDRTGILSFANFPVIWLFGMRNNLVLWLTGWDFGTYNNFHRWVARVATLQAVVHSIGYTAIIFREGGWTYFLYWWTLLFWWAGEAATILMCAILGFSVFWMRRQKYEMFLLIHIGLSVLVLITMLGHVSIFNGEYDALVWVPALIWVADRVLRGLRVLAFKLNFWSIHAQATYNPTANIVRLDIPTSPSLYRIRPGTFFYLTMLNDTNFWESHPFTVASTRDAGETKGGLSEAVPLLEEEQDDEIGPREVALSGAEHMSFLIRPYDSFTSRLKDLAEAQWPKPASVRVIVDGPYGNTLPLHTYDEVTFVVGGSGIVVPLSYIKALTTEARRPRQVRIHWAVRQREFATQVIRQDLYEALDYDSFHLDVYVTEGIVHETSSELRSRQIRWFNGRINAAEVVERAVKTAAAGSSLAVVACGPAKMADDSRRATVQGMQDSTSRIDYFEESFQW